ncbi:MAG: gamma-glutamyltransferase, partial [Planctomycetota bacterium]|nr:gamma-glutamyltransferase [Planctomycetota bacterium]
MSHSFFQAHRPVVMGTRGVVASAHPLASLAGLRILMEGGNAIDAAVAVASSLNVCEPFMSGAGGIGLMIVHRPGLGETRLLNFSGCAPNAATPDKFTRESQSSGIRAPLVPGNLGGWLKAHGDCGSMSLEQVFGPA